jgi:ATP-dependent DNA helicase RecG
LTVDGKWAPNLFNFYYRVYPRIVENIDVPFKLDKSATRLEETHVHEALREALVNTIVHADHQTTRSISIFNRHDMFTFVNPGRLRIPLAQLYQGGISDPRNPNLLKMFQMLGLVERAGSGFQKILRAWKEQHWIVPLVAENPLMELTGTFLPIVSMIPEDAEQELRLVVGDAYQQLDELGRTILMLAHRFGEIGNKDIQHYRNEHPTDIGIRLRQFVASGWLEKGGQGSGTRYKWPTSSEHSPDSSEHLLDSSEHSPDSSEHSPDSSEHSPDSSEHSPDSSEHSPDNSEHLDTEQEAKLLEIAAAMRNTNQRSKVLMESTILALCKDSWLNLRTLARLLDRQPDTLRNHYINRMLKDGRLEAKFPGKPHHPGQAYRKKHPK